MSDVDDDVGGEESEVVMAPDDTYADDDFDAAAATAEADDEPAQAEASYAEDDEYKDDPEPEPEPDTETEAEPSKKLQPMADEEQLYQDDFEQGPGASKMEDEAGDTLSAAVDDDYSDDSRQAANGNGMASAAGATAGAALLTKSSSKGSAAGSRSGSSTSSAAPKPASPAVKQISPVISAHSSSPVVAPKPANVATRAAAPIPIAKPAPKPAATAAKPAVPAALKAAPGAVKPAAPKSVVPVVNPKPAVSTRPSPPSAATAPSAIGAGGQKVKLTFTGPPNVARAAPVVKPDYSHSAYEVKKISSDNVKLCNRLVEISRAPPNPAYANPLSVGTAAVSGKLAPANVAASAVNRQKKEDRIAQENLALYKRLQTVKPSKDVNREVLSKDFARAQAYGDNARKVRAPPAAPAPPTATASTSAPKLAASGAPRQPMAGSAEAVYMRPSGSGSGSGSQAPAPAAMEMSTVPEGPEGEMSSASAWESGPAGGVQYGP